MKLFHSYQATKPFSGTDEAISSSQEDIPKQALDTVAGSLVLNELTVDVNKLPTEDFEDMSLVYSKH